MQRFSKPTDPRDYVASHVVARIVSSKIFDGRHYKPTHPNGLKWLPSASKHIGLLDGMATLWLQVTGEFDEEWCDLRIPIA